MPEGTLVLLINLLKSVVSFRYEAYFYRNWLKKFVYKWSFYKRSGGPSHPDMIGRPKVFVTVQKTQNTGIALSSPCLDLQHHGCIAFWEKARIVDCVHSFAHFFHIYTRSTATPTYHGNFALPVIFSGRKFQNIAQ